MLLWVYNLYFYVSRELKYLNILKNQKFKEISNINKNKIPIYFYYLG